METQTPSVGEHQTQLEVQTARSPGPSVGDGAPVEFHSPASSFGSPAGQDMSTCLAKRAFQKGQASLAMFAVLHMPSRPWAAPRIVLRSFPTLLQPSWSLRAVKHVCERLSSAHVACQDGLPVLFD